jgi:GST-like protein
VLGVLEQRLASRKWVMGDSYTIADIAIFPWVNNLIGFYEAGELVGVEDFPSVMRTLADFLERPTVARALSIPKQP